MTQTPQPMKPDQIESIASEAVSDALDFIESEISEDRIKAQRYFDGDIDLGHEEGRSRVVATKVRDTIRSVKPSLMRIFLSNEKYVEYIPRSPQDVGQEKLLPGTSTLHLLRITDTASFRMHSTMLC